MTDSLQTGRPLAGGRTVGIAAGLLAAETLGLVAVGLRDPHVPGSWGGCPVLALTGRPCPFCGGMRAAHDLVTGDLLRALSENAAGVVAVVGGVLVTVLWLASAVRAARRGEPDPAATLDDRRVVGTAVGLLLAWVAFGIARLWPPLAFLQP